MFSVTLPMANSEDFSYICTIDDRMPAIERITVADFRNIELQELSFSPNVNCIWGDNGEGKTNLLDAIHYLAMTKSAFSSSDRYNFRHGTQSFSMCATVRTDSGLQARFALQVDQDGKKLRRDDKPVKKFSEHIGEIAVVMVSPADTALVSESGDERRRFVNSVLSQIDREYLSAAQQYNRLLQQRNKLLKEQSPDDGLLNVLDLSMERYAAPVHEARREFTSRLSPIVNRYYSALSGDDGRVSVTYRSDLDRAPLSCLLAEGLERDRLLHFTGSGVQRDDFIFEMDGHPIRRCGSQGQQKSFLVALKFAQYEIMKESRGHAPILLLDDIFDKLDLGRTSNLLKMVSGSDFGQIFITDCNRDRLRLMVDGFTSDRACFETSGGRFNPVSDLEAQPGR